MIFEETAVKDVWIVTSEPRGDERGFFARTWCRDEFAAHGIADSWVQSSVSFNAKKGTLRGLHYQRKPREETKLVRCTRGRLLDVVLDVRPESPTFRKHVAVELSADNVRMVCVAKGCAHGFQTLVDETEVFYEISELYSPEHAEGVRWNDPAFGIQWPIANPVMSARDREYPDFDR